MKDIIKKYLNEARLNKSLKQYVAKWYEFPTGNRSYGGGGWSRKAKYKPKPELVSVITDDIKIIGKSVYVNGIRKIKLNLYTITGDPIREDYYDINFDSETLNEARLRKDLKSSTYSVLKKHNLLGTGIQSVTHGIKFEAPYTEELANDLESIGYNLHDGDMIFRVNNPDHPDYGKRYIEFSVYVGPDSPNRGLKEARLNKKFKVNITRVNENSKLIYTGPESTAYTKNKMYTPVDVVFEPTYTKQYIVKIKNDKGYIQSFTEDSINKYFSIVGPEGELNEMEPIQPTEVPKWESGITRSNANPIDYKQKWESGMTRGHANSLF